jgi:hypothetical protein
LSIETLDVKILNIFEQKRARWDSSKEPLFSILKGDSLAFLLMMEWNIRISLFKALME